MNVLIAGYGYVGKATAELFASHGHRVIGARRSVARDEPGIRMVQLDVTAESARNAISEPIDLIVCALSPDERTDEAYRKAYPDAVRNLTTCFPEARLLLISSTTVYAQSGGEEFDEQAPALSETFSAKRIREAEDWLLSTPLPHAILRASGIYGPGRTRLVSRLRSEALGRTEADVFTSRIHRDDLARALLFLAEHPKSTGIYLASDPTPATLGEMQSWILERFSNDEAELSPGAPSTRARKNRRARPARLLEEGFRFSYPSFREGYEALLERN